MVMKLYGWSRSPPVQLVATVLYEKQILFKYIDIDLLTYENRTPDFLAIQPFGQVPAIDDDGFVLYESRAIARYLEENYANQGTKLIPSDPKKRALFDQAASTEAFNFDRYGNPLIGEILFKKLRGGKTDPERVKMLTEILARKLDVYEKILSKQRYIAGDELTLADLYHLPVLGLFSKAKITILEERPNTTRWFHEISSRESWQKIKDGVVSDSA